MTFESVLDEIRERIRFHEREIIQWDRMPEGGAKEAAILRHNLESETLTDLLIYLERQR